MATVYVTTTEGGDVVVTDVFCPGCHRAIGPSYARCSLEHVRACERGNLASNVRWADAVQAWRDR